MRDDATLQHPSRQPPHTIQMSQCGHQRDGRTDCRAVQHLPASQRPTHLQNFIAGPDPAVLEGVALWVEAADEDGHARAVLVAGERQAEAAAALLQLDQQYLAGKVAVLLLDLLCREETERQPLAVLHPAQDGQLESQGKVGRPVSQSRDGHFN